MSENYKSIKKTNYNSSSSVDTLEQQEFFLSLKKYSWTASLTNENQIFIFNADNSSHNFLAKSYFLFKKDCENLPLLVVNGKYISYTPIYNNIWLIYDQNIFVAKTINDLLIFQEKFQFDIEFSILKRMCLNKIYNCNFEINDLKNKLNIFTGVLNKLK